MLYMIITSEISGLEFGNLKMLWESELHARLFLIIKSICLSTEKALRFEERFQAYIGGVGSKSPNSAFCL
jgi:hypothetical protein